MAIRRDPEYVDAPAPMNPLAMVHRLLRGRYPMVLGLAAVAGLIGATAGWMAIPPTYASQGWVRVFATQPRVLYQTEENEMMPMFDGFVRSQAELLRSRRVIDLAIAEDTMRQAGWPGQPRGASDLIKALDVGAQRGSALISVSVSHRDPQLAQIAANAVLTAFMRYQEEQEGMSVTDRERRLRENQQLLESELKTVRESMMRIGEEFDGGDIEKQLAAKSEQMTQIDAALATPEMIAAGVAPDEPASPEPAAPVELTVEQLAQKDAELAGLLTDKQKIEYEISAQTGRLGQNHPDMRSMRTRRDALNARIELRVAFVREQIKTDMRPEPLSRLAELRVQREAYVTLRARLAEEVRALARARMRLSTQRQREEEIAQRLAETNTALEAIRVENEVIRAGRVRVQQRAATPLAPDKDRRLPLAAAGFLGGAGSVVAGFVGVTMLRRRVRYADELESAGPLVPLIGVVPELDSDRAEDRQAVTLALHHVRNSLLMLRQPGRGGTVYLVTSAVQGEGKTTVSIALATSFALAGYRVTLIDADLVGRGVSHELGLDHERGLSDCLGRAPDDDAFQAGGVGRLRVMPAGRRDAADAHELTIEEVEPVLTAVRSNSDVIVVDTGPLLGSLEAGLFARMSDVLVLLAQRGTSGRLVRAAIDKARSFSGVRLLMMFNRAHKSDLTTSASYTSVYSRPVNGTVPKPGTGERSRLVRVLHNDVQEPTQV